MKSIAVFCGSSGGNEPSYLEMALRCGQSLAQRGIRVVYGGAKVGLMGAVADGALSAGGEVIGVLPRFMRSKEIAHENLTQLHLVESMHERKLLMHELSDGIIALPGGFGTMEELFEMLTWAQLGLHTKPIGVLNFNGYYKALLELADQMQASAFMRSDFRSLLIDASDIETLLKKMHDFKPIEPVIFIQENET